jgi:hypothetical protein
MTEFDYHPDQYLSREEQHWQYLWQTYFQRIGIESRYNPGLQSQCIPHRYRRHLVEFQQPIHPLND